MVFDTGEEKLQKKTYQSRIEELWRDEAEEVSIKLNVWKQRIRYCREENRSRL